MYSSTSDTLKTQIVSMFFTVRSTYSFTIIDTMPAVCVALKKGDECCLEKVSKPGRPITDGNERLTARLTPFCDTC